MGVAKDIQGLQQQLEQVRAEYHAENQRGALKDSHKVAELEAKMADISQRLDVEKRLAENEQVHEQRVEESHKHIAYTLDNLKLEDGTTMRELFRNESKEAAEFAYQVVSSAVKKMMMEDQESLLKEIRAKEDHLATAKAENEAQQKRYDELYETNAKLRMELAQAKAEAEEAERKRDAAATQLDEANKEITRLNSQVDDLRKEIAVGAAQAARVIDIGSENALEKWRKQRQVEEDSKPAIYDLEWADTNRSTYRAKLAETGEEITFNYLSKGKYREVTAQEAESFRRAAKERSHADMVQHGQNDVVEAQGELIQPQFQDVYGTEHGMDETHSGGKVEAEAAGSVEDRLKALEQRVTALEGRTKGEAA